MAQSSAKTPLFVAAIDFGTTYSGYAFSSKDGYAKEPLKINANVWASGARSLLSHKTPTALLLNPDKTFNSFGFDAENNYCNLNNNDDESDDDDSDSGSEKKKEDLCQKYYFFHRFKMLLHNNKVLRRNTMIADETGKKLSAKIVFTESIRYLKDHLLETITNQCLGIKKEEINYVLTVPAIWDDAAKQFMREATKDAGIPDNQLLIALEPEAASILCQLIQTEKEGTKLVAAQAGTKYLVADLGGGTADITVHEKQFDDTLKELRPASGGPWGGKAIDDAFIAFMSEICGAENIEILKKQSMDDYIDIFYREFETKKRTNVSDSKGKVTITLPYSLIQIIKKNRKGFKESIDLSKYANKVIFMNQRIQIPNPVFASLFEPTINAIINHINSILDERQFRDLDRILMVGGFSDCELVQEAFNKEFKEKKEKKIIVPDEAGMAVLKGAVLFGHKPTSIGSRVARYTYGIQSWPEWDAQKHPESKRVFIGGVARCKDAFFKYIEIGQEIRPGHVESQVFRALKPEENSLECSVYTSTKRDPVFVDEADCTLLGQLIVPLNKNRSGPVEVEESLVFGETEIRVTARDMKTGQQFETSFNLLGR